MPPTDPLFEKVRDMPVFQCPSDLGGFWNGSSSDTPWAPIYWECGSSYDENYHFVLEWARYQFPKDNPLRWQQRANAFLREQLAFEPSRFIILYEDPFDSAQWLNIPRRGWHQKWNRHSFLFLDGHAANMVTDTTKGNRGLGWKSASWSPQTAFPAWFNNPEDPDYQYRDITPLPGY